MSDLTFIRKPVRALSDKEYRDCYNLNFGRRGLMRDVLIEARGADSELNGTAFMLYRGDVLISWVLRFWSNGRWNIYVYTRTMERRKGYGEWVVKEAKRGIRATIAIHPWDSKSRSFYAKFPQDRLYNIEDAQDYEDEYA